MIKGQAFTLHFYAYDFSGGPATGITGWTVYVCKDSSTPALATNSVAEISATTAPGMYRITLTATEMNANVMSLTFSHADATAPPVLLETDNLSLIADAVCDEPLSGHATAGTLGKVVSDTATSTTATAISSAVGQIQTAVSTINSTVNSLQSTVVTINSNVSAISGYTDELEDMVENLPTASGIAQVVWGREVGDSTSRTLTGGTNLPTAAAIAQAVLTTDTAALSVTANAFTLKHLIMASQDSSIGTGTWTIYGGNGSTVIATRQVTATAAGMITQISTSEE